MRLHWRPVWSIWWKITYFGTIPSICKYCLLVRNSLGGGAHRILEGGLDLALPRLDHVMASSVLGGDSSGYVVDVADN